ncbi:hypothetical protein SK128_009986 [Halocaridina rubra]|uniref:Uncharacterized protein n=1 Tax=Halocaridina rubra TaxID=373956 RepID=A0AAN8X328_HALRR
MAPFWQCPRLTKMHKQRRSVTLLRQGRIHCSALHHAVVSPQRCIMLDVRTMRRVTNSTVCDPPHSVTPFLLLHWSTGHNQVFLGNHIFDWHWQPWAELQNRRLEVAMGCLRLGYCKFRASFKPCAKSKL